MSIFHSRCLVLNSSWFPIGIKNAFISIVKVYNSKASIISPVEYEGGTCYQEFNFDEWTKLEIREGHDFIRTKYLSFEIPEIIKVNYERLHIQKLPLKPENIFARDGYKCYYCGSYSDLTIDHILAQSKGGQNSWRNLVTCCKKCNNEKGDMDVNKFCEIKTCNIPCPVNVGSFPWLKEIGKKYPESWKKWLNFS
jgi:5-methylcytosine-specific restriction endonuclease McrA